MVGPAVGFDGGSVLSADGQPDFRIEDSEEYRAQGFSPGGSCTRRRRPSTLRPGEHKHALQRLAAGSAWNDSGGLVFINRWGEPLYPDTVSALMTKLINRYNRSLTAPAEPLPHARLHDLRHLHATTLLLAGVPVHVVAARLGHADPAVTLRVYSHVLREHAAGVGDIFAHAVKPMPSRRLLANPLARRQRRSDRVSVCAGESGGQGRGRTADLPLFRCILEGGGTALGIAC